MEDIRTKHSGGRIVSLLLMALVLLLAVCTVTVFAYGEKNGTDNGNDASVSYTQETGANSTSYGTIPDEYADVEEYPFAVFDGVGNFIGAYAKLYSNSDSAVNAAKDYQRNNVTWNSALGKHVGASAVVLARRDYDSTNDSYYNWAQIPGEITIDLGGYTVTNTHGTNSIFDIESKISSINGIYFHPTTVNVINGTLKTKAVGFLRLKANETDVAAANSIGDKLYTLNFSGVTFAFTEDATASAMMISYRSIDSADKTIFESEKIPAPYEFNFDGCTFDITNNSKSSFTVFNADPDASRWVKVGINVIGSKIVANSMSGVSIFASNGANGSSVLFSKNAEDEYLKIESLDTSYNVENAFPTDDGIKFLVQDENNKGNYTLGESTDPTVTKYGKLPENYDAEKYPFALFFDGEYVGGYTHWANTADTDSGNDYKDVIQQAKNKVGGAAGAGKTAYVLLCRDYALDSTSYAKDKNGSLINEKYNNYSQIGGTLVLDLGGYTLTLGAEHFITANAKATSDVIHDSAYKLVNGTVKLGAKSVVYYDSNSNLKSSKNMDVTFDGITFDFVNKSGVSLIGQGTFSGTADLNANIIFNGCTFDLGGVTSDAFNLLDLDDAELDSTVTVSGGRIIAGESTFGAMTLLKGEKYAALTFTEAKKGGYVKLYTTDGAVAPTRAFMTDKGDKYFVRTGTAEYGEKVCTVYSLGDKALTSYSPKMSITLETQLKLNVYIPVNSTLSFTIDGDSYTNVAEANDKIVKLGDGNRYYKFSIPLASAEAARDVKLTASVEIAGASAKVSFTFSTLKYAAKLLGSANTVEKTLARDVLQYVKAAYNYDGFAAFNTTAEIARVNAEIEALIGDYTAEPTLSGEVNTVAPVTAVTLNLNEKPTVRFYVTDTGVSFYANGKKLKTVEGVDEIFGKYLELDVYAYALAETVTYGDGGSYHISDFVKSSEGKSSEALAKAFQKYVESAAAYRNSVLTNGSDVVKAEIVNKNGTSGTVTFVIDDGDRTTATFVKEMLLKYTDLGVSFAVPGKKLATLKTEDKNGDGIPEYVMVNGKYVYEVDEESYDFWCDVLSVGRSEIVNHSYTHGFFGSDDNGGTYEYVKNNQSTVTVSDVIPVGSVTKEIYASKQILEELFPEYLSKNKTMISYIGAGIGVRTADYTLPDGTVIKSYKPYLDALLAEAYTKGAIVGVSTTFGQNYSASLDVSTKVITKDNFTENLRLSIPRYMIEHYNANPEGVLNDDISNWTDFIDAAIDLDGWACFCIHKIRETIPENSSDHFISEAQAEMLFKYASDNNLWIATNSEAMLYFSEWSTATVNAELDGDKINVTLTDGEDNSIYTEELTVKVTIPATWSGVTVNGEALEVARNADGTGYVLVNIVPDSGVVTLTAAQ